MKIGNCASTPVTAPVPPDYPTARAAETLCGHLDHPALDDVASDTTGLPRTAAGRPDRAPDQFDADKVERIRQAIADGSYRVNPEAIADKMISNAQDLLDHLGRNV
jgi:negative regulator of flagellin synthesis FlgM